MDGSLKSTIAFAAIAAAITLTGCGGRSDQAVTATDAPVESIAPVVSEAPITAGGGCLGCETTEATTTTAVPETTTTTTSTTSTTTTTTIDPLVVAQGAYFVLSGTANEALGNAGGYQGNDPEWCAAQLALNEDFVLGMQETDWPDYAQETADVLIRATQELVVVAFSCANNGGNLDSLAWETADNALGTAATDMRLVLDLPITRSP